MTGRRSVYPSQVLAVSKSTSIDVEVGRQIDDVETSYDPSERPLVTKGLLLLRSLCARLRRGEKPR
jgi:hypothetical protein